MNAVDTLQRSGAGSMVTIFACVSYEKRKVRDFSLREEHGLVFR